MPEQHAQQDPARVPDVLQAWVTALSGLDQAQRIQQAVLHLLNTRPGHSQAKAEHVSPADSCSRQLHVLMHPWVVLADDAACQPIAQVWHKHYAVFACA